MRKANLALLLVTILLASGARAEERIARIGFLGGSTPEKAAHLLQAFKQGLSELGYVEGKNVVIEARFAGGRVERLPRLAAELVQKKVDVIFAPPTVAAQAALQATRTIPIAFALVANPVESGFVATLARPGGNITGLSTINAELGAKRLELLKEAFPDVSRVAVLYSPADNSNLLQLEHIESAARKYGVTLLPLAVRSVDGFSAAFAAIAQERADALFVMENPVNFTHRDQVVRFAHERRLLAMYALREFVDAGGLMSYAVNFPDQFRRAAVYVDKILKGARPGELPVQQPTRIEFIVNRKAAIAHGFAIPSEVLLRADEVIQ